MIVLVANLGSTSFKYKLFDMAANERVLAEGAADRIGLSESDWTFTPSGKPKRSGREALPDHGAAIELHLRELVRAGVIAKMEDVHAIGFKAVHGGPLEVVRVDDQVLEIMQQFADVAPAHNPPYIAAMRAFARRLPDIPQVAAFETAFHQTIPLHRQAYAIPYEWTEKLEIRRYGFHGASHRYIATRVAELNPAAHKIISVHLGGSSSINATLNGKSVANSFGMTAQSGLPQASRCGDFDTFALLKLLQSGIKLEDIWKKLGKEGGLLGVSGVSSDCRDIEQAAAQGNKRAQLALSILVESARQYIGAYLAVLNGADVIAFTGGIGQNAVNIRQWIISDMQYAGIILDTEKNRQAHGECRIDGPGGRVQIWVLPTNEELIVARQTVRALETSEQEAATAGRTT
ncbi:MAG: acetate/propionate family kinase [Planctomycetia bacterium]|nr:acetate/propionate family kinase [Planctomycetia bacterium]